jgi:hypothetical protein
MQDLSRLYDRDYAAWAERTTELLRDGRFSELDVEHLIEELSDMGKSQQHDLVNRLRVLLAHLLKWEYQYRLLSDRSAEFEGKSWRNTIIEQRAALAYLLRKNPGLKSMLEGAAVEAYAQAVEVASAETGLPVGTFPATCPYEPAAALDSGFFPISR